jgi:hypothetical protein
MTISIFVKHKKKENQGIFLFSSSNGFGKWGFKILEVYQTLFFRKILIPIED